MILNYSLVIFSLLHYVLCDTCQSLLKTTDDCVRRILYIGDDNLQAIRTQTQLESHCRQIKDDLKCLKKYGKCLRLFPKQVFQLSVRSTNKIIKARCDSEDGQKEFLQHTACIRKPQVFTVNRCIDKYVLMMNYVAVNGSENDQIPALCCAFQILVECLKQKTDVICLDVTGKETGTYVAQIAKTFAKDIIELACGNRQSVDECERIEPKWMNTFKSLTTPFSSIKRQNTGVFVPLIAVAKRIDTETPTR